MRQIRTVVCAIAFLTGACATSQAGVVFGNLGSAGTGTFSSTTEDYGPGQALTELAVGFSTGASQELQVQSITLGLFGISSGTEQLDVKILSDAGGNPGTVLYTSSSIAVGGTASYTFPFSSATLSSSTTYWIVPQGGADTAWYWGDTLAAEQNGSGYSFVGARENTGSAWVDSIIPSTTNPKPFAVSVNAAVPEPSAVVLAIGGVAALGLFRVRRRFVSRQ